MTLLNAFEINTLSSYGIEMLYELFKDDFITNQTSLTKNGTSFPIDIKRHVTCPCPYGNTHKPEKFWHTITRDKKNGRTGNNPCPDHRESQRIYDKARAKRIKWIKILIDNWQTDSNIVHFYQQRNTREDNLILWHKQKKFLVIIRKIGRTTNRFLVSSYLLFDTEEHRYERQLQRYNRSAPTGSEWF